MDLQYPQKTIPCVDTIVFNFQWKCKCTWPKHEPVSRWRTLFVKQWSVYTTITGQRVLQRNTVNNNANFTWQCNIIEWWRHWRHCDMIASTRYCTNNNDNSSVFFLYNFTAKKTPNSRRTIYARTTTEQWVVSALHMATLFTTMYLRRQTARIHWRRALDIQLPDTHTRTRLSEWTSRS